MILPMCDLPGFGELLKCYKLSIKKWGEKHFWALYIINPVALSKQTTLVLCETSDDETHKVGVQAFWKKILK